ncbi:hypothetical protein BGY98DRAFT_1092285 [Russula aff. rugulosa BPL654]|nr:hypothetical protein BGY98DRAFT_1092285 [Russula aff. rugulosa BPL654]
MSTSAWTGIDYSPQPTDTAIARRRATDGTYTKATHRERPTPSAIGTGGGFKFRSRSGSGEHMESGGSSIERLRRGVGAVAFKRFSANFSASVRVIIAAATALDSSRLARILVLPRMFTFVSEGTTHVDILFGSSLSLSCTVPKHARTESLKKKKVSPCQCASRPRTIPAFSGITPYVLPGELTRSHHGFLGPGYGNKHEGWNSNYCTQNPSRHRRHVVAGEIAYSKSSSSSSSSMRISTNLKLEYVLIMFFGPNYSIRHAYDHC